MSQLLSSVFAALPPEAMQPDLRIAIILFNLGGPDSLDAVRPFLRNLFGDPAIVRLPNPLRAFLAQMLSRKRAPIARRIYAEMGGASPILPNTLDQARALETALSDLGQVRAFPVMRYWHPRAEDVLHQVLQFAPKRLIELPLYPQFSTTTTASSMKEWDKVAGRTGLKNLPTHKICCYPDEIGFIDELAKRIVPSLDEAQASGRPRLLLSAHGLPEKIVAAGDPYPWQVERTAEALRNRLDRDDYDLVVCYQSRVGPLKWIGPATADEVARAGRDKRPVVLAPIAFVSEHSETLVELDIELAAEAKTAGVPLYLRAPTVDAGDSFIEGLARLVRNALGWGPGLRPSTGARLCGADRIGCPYRDIAVKT